MKKIFKITCCIALALLFSGQLLAQSKHELSVTGGLGLSSLSFDVNKGDHSGKFGGMFGVNYSYFINSSFSLNTGLEYTIYAADGKIKNLNDSYKAVDAEGENFLFNTSVSNYKEKQSATYLNIPVMVQYQILVLKEHQVYATGGFKIGLPLSGSYKTSGASFKTTGTMINALGSPTMENIPGLGFSEFTGKKKDEDLDFKTSFILSLEAGMKWQLPTALSLYTGIYFDYGLNDIRKDSKNQQFLLYEPPYAGKRPEEFHLNSMLQSQYTNEGKTRSMTDKVYPMALGVKMRLAFSIPR